MKKFLLALILSLCLMPVAVMAEAEFTDISDTELERALGLITYLDIMSGYDDDTFRGENSITRAEFAVTVAHMLKLEEQHNKDNIYYIDVPQNHWAAGSIAQLTEKGIISGYGNGYFGIDDTIKTIDGYAMVLKLLAYGDFVAVRGGYPSGVYKIAHEIELDESVSSDETLTRRDAAILIFNALRTKSADITSISDSNTVYTKGSGDTLLETYWDMDWVEGKVTGVENTGLYQPESLTSEQIEIDNVIYQSEIENSIEYIGRNVEAYYKINDDNPCVVYVYKNIRRYEEIRIDAELIDNVSDSYEVTYYDGEESSRVNRKSIAGNAAVIYNGLAAESYTKDDLMPEVGSLTLIFDKSSSAADTVIVESYERFIAGNVDVLQGKISNAEDVDKYIIVSDDEFEKVTVKSSLGMDMTLSEIKENHVLMIKKSLGEGNARIIEIIVSDDVVSGTINSINHSDNEIEINGNVYEISPQYAELADSRISTFNAVIAYLDSFGKIANIKGDVTDDKLFGYLINGVYNDEGFEETINLKIFTQDGEVVSFSSADKIRIDGIQYKSSSSNLNFQAALNALSDGGSVKPQLIVYTPNADKKIYSIDTVNKSEKEDDYSLRLNITKGTYKYKSDGQIGGKGIADNNTIVFEIPNNPQQAEDNAFAVKKRSSLTNNQNITVESYALAPKVEYETIMLVYSDNTGAVKDSASSVMVQEVHTALNSDDCLVEVLTAMTNGVSSEYYAEDGFSFSAEGIKEGDIIRLAFNNANEVSKIEPIVSLGETPSWAPTNDKASIDGGFKRTFAYATEKIGKVLRVGYEANGIWDEVYVIPNKITVYDSTARSGYKIYSGTIDDINTYEYFSGACNQVYIHTRNSVVQSVFVYK